MVDGFLQLPAFVGPRPVGGCGVDLLLDEPGVALGEIAAPRGVGRAGERPDVHFVVAAAGAAHGDEENGGTRDARDFLLTRVEGRGAVEEGRPMLLLPRGG